MRKTTLNSPKINMRLRHHLNYRDQTMGFIFDMHSDSNLTNNIRGTVQQWWLLQCFQLPLHGPGLSPQALHDFLLQLDVLEDSFFILFVIVVQLGQVRLPANFQTQTETNNSTRVWKRNIYMDTYIQCDWIHDGRYILQWRSYRGAGGGNCPPPLALENGKFGNLPSGGKWHPTTVRFWILITSYVDMDFFLATITVNHSSDDVLQEYNLLCNMFRMWKREDTPNLPRTTGKVLKYLNDKNLVHVHVLNNSCLQCFSREVV